MNTRDLINKWVKMCEVYDECAKCPIGNAVGGEIECGMLFTRVRPQAEKLDEVQSIIEKWEKEKQ